MVRYTRQLLLFVAVAGATTAACRLAVRFIRDRQSAFVEVGQTASGRRLVAFTGPGVEWLNAHRGIDNSGDPTRTTGYSRINNYLAEAVARLDEQPLIPLTADEYLRYTGEPLTTRQDFRPVLVRGVDYEVFPAAIQVTTRGNTVVLAIPAGEFEMVKRPLIVWVEEVPARLIIMPMYAA